METLTISVLNEILEPTGQDCSTIEQDLQLALTLNPDLRVIQQAMRTYGTRQIDLYKERVRDALKESGSVNCSDFNLDTIYSGLVL